MALTCHVATRPILQEVTHEGYDSAYKTALSLAHIDTILTPQDDKF